MLDGKEEPIYDVLLIDEAQDFLPTEIAAFRRLARDLFLVADGRQMIYDTNSQVANLEAAVDRTLNLRFHYRNGPEICEVADGIGRTFSSGYEAIGPTCNYDSSQFRASVDVFEGTPDQQIATLAERLEFTATNLSGGISWSDLPTIRGCSHDCEGLVRYWTARTDMSSRSRGGDIKQFCPSDRFGFPLYTGRRGLSLERYTLPRLRVWLG